MRLLISGGTGMIGTLLVTRLLEKGHEISILTRKNRENNNLSNLRYLYWDGSSLGDWCEQINHVDAIINLAGENIGLKRWSDKRKQQITESRINAGRILTEAIKKATNYPKVFVQASAIGYYGTKVPGILTEESPNGDDFLADLSQKWERSSYEIESLGIRRIVIRTGVVLSKNDGALNRMLLPFKLFVGGPIGSGRQIISWIHPEDEIAAIEFLLEKEETSGAYNLTAQESISNAAFGRLLAKTIHRPYWFPVPGMALRLLLGEMSTLVLNGQNVAPKRLIEAGFQFKFGQLNGALKNLMA
jgi:uncharacterized protein (TIGR01777 family)